MKKVKIIEKILEKMYCFWVCKKFQYVVILSFGPCRNTAEGPDMLRDELEAFWRYLVLGSAF